ncbi:amino acid permease [Paucilactobacillus wasatchensis]|uniref:D-serine/D-alanine/glycine transporter n=1 Tax=Paucilactobacillus wasatchensis TaxID=1335616 RepID=A0A0D1A9A9_9LACO|nr:amino acid permease [Paucilactobacillus wasatchensis]KIS04302.1 D-serine/D-alanine/glycine transporter [Paucilactobacillus wasatchensis]
MDPADQPKERQLERGLKNRHVQLIAIGGTIGTGLFLGAGQSIHMAGPAIIFSYIVTGLMCFLLMRALGELLLSDLSLHSFVDFVKVYLGRPMGFVTGWTYWICWITIAMAEITAIGVYIRFWWPQIPQWLPGFVALILLLAVNLIAVSVFGEFEFWFALIKVVAIIGLIIIGVVMLLFSYHTPTGTASLGNLVNFGGLFPKGFGGIVDSLQMVVFSFIGIEMVGLTFSETSNPTKVLPKAINEIPIRIIIFYVGALFIIMSIYPWNKLPANESPFVQVFNNVGVPFAASIVNFVVITAAASACNSSLYTTGRMLYGLTWNSKSGLGRQLNKLSSHKVPAASLTFSTIIIAVSVALNYFIPDQVFVLVSSTATTAFLFIWGTIIVAHIKYRRSGKNPVSFKLPLFPISDYLVLIFLVLVLAAMCLEKTTLITIVLALVWFAVMFLVGYFADKREVATKKE